MQRYIHKDKRVEGKPREPKTRGGGGSKNLLWLAYLDCDLFVPGPEDGCPELDNLLDETEKGDLL